MHVLQTITVFPQCGQTYMTKPDFGSPQWIMDSTALISPGLVSLSANLARKESHSFVMILRRMWQYRDFANLSALIFRASLT